MFAEKTNNRGGTSAGIETLSAERQAIQRKLSVGSANDPQEQQADTMADTVMRMPEQGFVQRKCHDCEKEEQLQRQSSGDGQPAVSDQTAGVIQSSAGGGSPLDENTQSFMSSRMGSDFGTVKIHTDGEAVQLSRELNAKAFTVGKDIYFNEGQYQPDIESGRHLLAHELTHTIQQTGSTPAVQKKDEAPDKKDATPDKLETDKQDILEALHKSDSMGLLSRLRALDAAAATSLLADTPFWQELKKSFHGSALWSVFTILFFHGKMSLNQRMLSIALFSKKISDAMDNLAVIIARENVADPMYWDVLEEVIFTVFEGEPKLPDLFKMIILPKSQYSGPRSVNFNTRWVHYETNAAGAYEMALFGSNSKSVAYSTRNEFRVVVTIRFVDGQNTAQPYTFRGANESGIPDKWKSNIETVWNNQFELSNGIDTLKFTVSPMFTYESGQEDATVSILNSRTQSCPGVLQAGRANALCWFTDAEPDTVAHEFGHLLGAGDEYQLPGTVAEIPADKLAALSEEDKKLTTKTGIENDERPAGTSPVAPLPAQTGGYPVTGLMGLHSKEDTKVKGRHISALVNAFNASLPPGTPPYQIKKL